MVLKTIKRQIHNEICPFNFSINISLPTVVTAATAAAASAAAAAVTAATA